MREKEKSWMKDKNERERGQREVEVVLSRRRES